VKRKNERREQKTKNKISSCCFGGTVFTCITHTRRKSIVSAPHCCCIVTYPSGTGVGFNKTTKPRLVVYSSDNISSVINAIASSALIPVQIIL
jgi:hypothetical protein